MIKLGNDSIVCRLGRNFKNWVLLLNSDLLKKYVYKGIFRFFYMKCNVYREGRWGCYLFL